MFSFIVVALLATTVHPLTHHLVVGTTDGRALYSLETDVEARGVYMIQARDAAGASSSLALDRSRTHLFSSRPSDGTLTRYSVASNYELVSEGSMDIPSSCNTTNFTSLHVSSSNQNLGIWGTASTGTCSVLFGLTSDGYTTLRSKEIAGDVHSIAWSPTGRNLHALNSHSSASSTTSITNFRIAENPNLEDIAGTDVLVNVTSASQIVSHPTSDMVYLITKDTNELVTLPLQQNVRLRYRANLSPSRYRLLPSSLDVTQFHTSSLAITSSKTTLWTLSQSPSQAVITAFSLNTTTGEVLGVAARASWKGAGEGQLVAAPFEAGDVVAVTNSPAGYITILGLDQSPASVALELGQNSEHNYLQAIPVTQMKRDGMQVAAAKIQSYGRTILDDSVGLGECVWID
ncbi:Nn.00g015320.m01.CDS01 [Neocucurbitaria sp. VM-36]